MGNSAMRKNTRNICTTTMRGTSALVWAAMMSAADRAPGVEARNDVALFHPLTFISMAADVAVTANELIAIIRMLSG